MKPPSLLFIEYINIYMVYTGIFILHQCILSGRRQAASLTKSPPFQEVVEKNLRLTQDSMKKRDDAESVDNDSTMSTSSNLEPFANDDLGILMHLITFFFSSKGLKGGL